MIWKKSAFSYLPWIIYTAFTGIGLVVSLAGFCAGAGLPAMTGFVISAVLFVAGLVLSWLFDEKISIKQWERSERTARIMLMAEGVIMVLLLAAGLVLRIMGLAHAAQDSAYFAYAKIAQGQTLPRLVHGMEYLYLELLHGLFFLVGNKLTAAYWLQILLQLFAVVLLYFAVRKLAGVLPACSMLAFVALSPGMQSEALTLSPRMFYLLLYALVLCFLSFLLMNHIQAGKAWLIVGILGGILIYLDILGMTLILFLAGIFWVKPLEEEGKPGGGAQKGKQFFSGLSGMALGLLESLIVDSFASGKAIDRIVMAVLGLYEPDLPSLAVAAPVTGAGMETVILLGVLSLGIFSFRCNSMTDEGAVFILASLAVALLWCFGMTTPEMDGRLMLYLFLTVLAGIGIQNFVKRRQLQEVTEERPKEDEEQQNVQAASEKNEKGGEVVTVNVDGETREVKLLHNPLPVPKKHVRKALDYDIEVADDDDYDIK